MPAIAVSWQLMVIDWSNVLPEQQLSSVLQAAGKPLLEVQLVCATKIRQPPRPEQGSKSEIHRPILVVFQRPATVTAGAIG